jgi:hypothetical protein
MDIVIKFKNNLLNQYNMGHKTLESLENLNSEILKKRIYIRNT